MYHHSHSYNLYFYVSNSWERGSFNKSNSLVWATPGTVSFNKSNCLVMPTASTARFNKSNSLVWATPGTAGSNYA